VPHLTIEYSANLETSADIAALCRALHSALMASGLIEIGAPRVRAVRCDAYAIADLAPENAFADMVLRMGAGRSEGDRKALGDRLMAAATEVLAMPLQSPHFALSLEIVEIGAGMSWKRNTMHARLRG
jgi:5-carboxymethyl-2-hydroxymuconate isomerase